MIKIKTNNIHSKEKHYILETIFSDILGLKISFESSQEENYVVQLPNEKKSLFQISSYHPKLTKKNGKNMNILNLALVQKSN